MTSISALSSHHHHTSASQRLQDELQTEVDSGAVSSTDQTALSSALGDIASALQSGSASDQSSGSGSSPGVFKSKIDDLIQQEVSTGKLTDQQATELQGVFKAAFAHGPGGPGGAGGPPPSDGSASVNGTDSSSSSALAPELLQQFLQSLKDSLADSTYSAAGSGDPANAGNPALSGVLLNDRI